MNNKNTLYISDLDGTLLNKSAELTAYSKNTLNEMLKDGLNFSVATARLLEPVRKMLADVKVSIPIILMNGVLIFDIENEKYVKVNRLIPDTVLSVIQAIKDFDVMGFMYELTDKGLNTYHASPTRPLNDYLKNRILKYNSIFPDDGLSSISPENIIYFTLIDTQDRLQPIHDALASHPNLNQTLYRNIYSPDSWFLEVFSSDSSKQSAVDFLRETYGFEYIVGFGDNHNDLPMFSACDMCIAVENATEDVKLAADYICDTNDNDGVVKWLKESLK